LGRILLAPGQAVVKILGPFGTFHSSATSDLPAAVSIERASDGRRPLAVEWTTQNEEHPSELNGHAAVPIAEQATAELQPAPASPPASLDHCSSCGAPCNSDQRYCLSCGLRRGDPRLPFMDAVVFMEAMKQPAATTSPPAARKRRRISPNAALIAGVGTLLLALGIGVLIGRSGGETVAAPQQAPIVIKSDGAAGGGETTTASTGAGPAAKADSKKQPKKAVAKQKQQAAEAGKGAEEVLKPKAGVNLPPPTAAVGDKCAKGTAGCEDGEFTGSFFGE
jgi:hypothetical protein